MAGRIWGPVAGDKLLELVREEEGTHRRVLHREKRFAFERCIDSFERQNISVDLCFQQIVIVLVRLNASMRARSSATRQHAPLVPASAHRFVIFFVARIVADRVVINRLHAAVLVWCECAANQHV
jgi:hypothetical protein